MSAQRLSPRSVRRIERSTGLSIVRAWGHGGYDMAFVTPDHRHGEWSKKDGSWRFVDPSQVLHYSSCAELFPAEPGPPAPVEPREWGLHQPIPDWQDEAEGVAEAVAAWHALAPGEVVGEPVATVLRAAVFTAEDGSRIPMVEFEVGGETVRGPERAVHVVGTVLVAPETVAAGGS